MDKYNLKQEDYVTYLREQLYFLDSSLTSFTDYASIENLNNKKIGSALKIKLKSEIEAKRIAVILRVLLHDTNQSKSLFKHLEFKDKLEYLDTANPNDSRLHSMTGMIGVRGNNPNQYFGLIGKVNSGNDLIAVPLYNQHLPEWYNSYYSSNFQDWWQKIVIKIDENEFTRETLVKLVANKDGGAHVNKEGNLPNNYYNAKQTKLKLNVQGNFTDFDRNVIYASIAQIGWEVLNSINELDCTRIEKSR